MSATEPYPGDAVSHLQDDDSPADTDLPDAAFLTTEDAPQEGPDYA